MDEVNNQSDHSVQIEDHDNTPPTNTETKVQCDA